MAPQIQQQLENAIENFNDYDSSGDGFIQDKEIKKGSNLASVAKKYPKLQQRHADGDAGISIMDFVVEYIHGQKADPARIALIEKALAALLAQSGGKLTDAKLAQLPDVLSLLLGGEPKPVENHSRALALVEALDFIDNLIGAAEHDSLDGKIPALPKAAQSQCVAQLDTFTRQNALLPGAFGDNVFRRGAAVSAARLKAPAGKDISAFFDVADAGTQKATLKRLQAEDDQECKGVLGPQIGKDVKAILAEAGIDSAGDIAKCAKADLRLAAAGLSLYHGGAAWSAAAQVAAGVDVPVTTAQAQSLAARHLTLLDRFDGASGDKAAELKQELTAVTRALSRYAGQSGVALNNAWLKSRAYAAGFAKVQLADGQSVDARPADFLTGKKGACDLSAAELQSFGAAGDPAAWLNAEADRRPAVKELL